MSCINWAGLEGLKKWDLTGIEREGVFLEQEDTNTLYRSRRLWEEMEDLKDANFFVELARDNSPTIASAGGKIHIRSKMGKIIYSYNSIQSSERETAGGGEAEGLYAQLNRRGHVDTCITSDSDAFLFGAKYIKDGLGVKRRHMIAIALLVGNDHDLKGVQGIWLETALSYVKSFSENDEARDLIPRILVNVVVRLQGDEYLYSSIPGMDKAGDEYLYSSIPGMDKAVKAECRNHLGLNVTAYHVSKCRTALLLSGGASPGAFMLDSSKGINNVGVVVTPVCLTSLSQFGDPQFVSNKLIQAEKRKESTKDVQIVSSMERPSQNGGVQVYEFEYKLDSTMGGLKAIFSVAFVASQKLYLLNIAHSDNLKQPLTNIECLASSENWVPTSAIAETFVDLPALSFSLPIQLIILTAFFFVNYAMLLCSSDISDYLLYRLQVKNGNSALRFIHAPPRSCNTVVLVFSASTTPIWLGWRKRCMVTVVLSMFRTYPEGDFDDGSIFRLLS
ncbi:PsbP domain-containing protein 2, chloroplastic [Tanacetum coccineum]